MPRSFVPPALDAQEYHWPESTLKGQADVDAAGVHTRVDAANEGQADMDAAASRHRTGTTGLIPSFCST